MGSARRGPIPRKRLSSPPLHDAPRQRLTRHFGGLRAVGDLSVEVKEGEILGLIGPNGAGKTTVFNLVTGFVRPSAGAIRLDGQSVVGLWPHAVVKRGLMAGPKILMLDEPSLGLAPIMPDDRTPRSV